MARRSSGLRFQSPAGESRSTLPVGKRQKLRIERLSHDGRGIAFLEGRTWFVINALPGEEVDARVLSSRSKVVDARAERHLSLSPERREPLCSHAGQCGGCNLQHLPAESQRLLKQQTLADQLARAGIHPERWAEPLFGPEWGYRRRARLAVRWNPKTKQLAVGFRAAASQEIVVIQECPVLEPALQALIPPLQALLAELQSPAVIGHLELFSGTALALLVRLTGPLNALDRQRLLAFSAQWSLQLWLQTENEPQCQNADASLGYALEQWALQLACQPGDFVQVNAVVNATMIAQALDWLAPKPNEPVLDLFCGLGNFALPLARQGAQVLGLEGVAHMVRRAQANAEHNALASAQFRCADLAKEEPLMLSGPWAHPVAVLLDPPREGAQAVVATLGSTGAKRILYVSCNPATLARDGAILAAQGYRMTRAGVLDMFPQTAHVEAMGLFEKD